MKIFKTVIFISIIFFTICIFPTSCVKAVGHNAEYDAPEIDISNSLEKVAKVPVVGGGVCQSFTLINDEIYAANIILWVHPKDTGYLYLGNFKDGSLIRSSAARRTNHSNGLTYDFNRKKLVVATSRATVYDVDLLNKKIIYNKLLNMGGNALGYSSSLDKFVRASGGNIRVYKGEDFYHDKLEYQFGITMREDLHDPQSGEAFGNCFFYVLTDRLRSGNNISGNTILVVNLQTRQVQQQIYLGDTPDEEFEDCSFDSQGNLYVVNGLGQVYKTDYNAYAEGVIATATQPTNRTEALESLITNIINSFLDFVQTLLESFESSEDFTNISLTASSSEIVADESLQKDIQFVSAVNQDENQDNNQTDEDNNNSDAESENIGESSEDDLELLNAQIKSTITDKYGNEENVYSYNTPIPKISMSFENFMLNKSILFDLDFINLKHDNQNIFWQYIRNFVVLITRITVFISASLFISSIILRAILIIVFSLKQDADKVASSKKILGNVIKATVLIIGIFVLIELIIYFYNFLVSMILANKTKKYIINANVEGLYSFNTSFMGLMKYLSLSTNIFDAFIWCLFRLLVTIGNVILFYRMLRRTFTIIRLIIMAPFTAVAAMFEKKERKGILADLDFEVYIKNFTKTVFYPFIYVIIISLFM